MFTGLSPRNTCWSRSIVNTNLCSVISFTVRVFGTATSIPDCSTGAVIMKITSSTSTTSTSGVMLMSARDERVWPLLLVKATLYLLRLIGRSTRSCRCAHGNLFERVEQLAAEVVGGRCEYPNARGELVVSHHGGYCNEQAGGRGDKRFGNARRDRAQCCSSRSAQSVKGIDDAHHCAEKSDERARRRDCCEPC